MRSRTTGTCARPLSDRRARCDRRSAGRPPWRAASPARSGSCALATLAHLRADFGEHGLCVAKLPAIGLVDAFLNFLPEPRELPGLPVKIPLEEPEPGAHDLARGSVAAGLHL